MRRQNHKSLSSWAVTNNRKSNIKKGMINNESASSAFCHVFASIRKTHTTQYTCRKIINISHCYLIYETVCINDFRVSATLVSGIVLNLCLLFFIQIYLYIFWCWHIFDALTITSTHIYVPTAILFCRDSAKWQSTIHTAHTLTHANRFALEKWIISKLVVFYVPVFLFAKTAQKSKKTRRQMPCSYYQFSWTTEHSERCESRKWWKARRVAADSERYSRQEELWARRSKYLLLLLVVIVVADANGCDIAVHTLRLISFFSSIRRGEKHHLAK